MGRSAEDGGAVGWGEMEMGSGGGMRSGGEWGVVGGTKLWSMGCRSFQTSGVPLHRFQGRKSEV